MDLRCIQDAIGISPITFLSTVLVILLGILYYQLKNKDLPPGPIGIPVFGYWPFLRDDDLHLHLTEMSKKYGDVFCFDSTGKTFIHLGSIKAIKEAHIAKSDCFTERYSDYSLINELFGKGLVAVNGEEWRTLRKFFIQSFKEYGLTSVKEYMTGPIYDAVYASVEVLKCKIGAPINIIAVLKEASCLILRSVLFSCDEITDEELRIILECYENMLPIFQGKKLILLGNMAKYFIFPRTEGFKSCLENHEMMVEYLRTIVKRHEDTYFEIENRDLIDGYIRERNERKKKGDPTAEYFTEDALINSLTQIVGDGVLGISIFVAYFMDKLLEHPEEQEKIYEELESVIGPDRSVTLEDRSKLSYTNAFMQEVMRTTDFFTFFPSMMCTKETNINGYRIPKGSITLVNFWGAHHDPNVFDEPDEFRPSRYIAEPEKPKAEAPVIFGAGKRSCAGESFTMMQVFLFVATIVKNFKLERPPGYEKKMFYDGLMEVCPYLRKQET